MQFNNNKTKIGILTPYSSIYPNMIPSIVNGFYCSMSSKYQEEFQFIPEYIKQGGDKVVKEAVQKLIQYDRVDIVSGIISYRSVPELIPIIESHNKVAFFFDMGEYIPYVNQLSNTVFYNSFQLWQSEFALGYWTQKKFGDKGLVIMPLYDSGYHLQSAFRQGTIYAGSKFIDYLVLPYKEGKSQVIGQVQDFFEKIKKTSPSYLHALFCGTEAFEFFDEFKKSGLGGNIPLVVSAHMASEEILDKVRNLDLKFYSASMWDYNRVDELNKKFKASFLQQTGGKADVFSLLGYEMGLAFNQLYPQIKKKDWKEVVKNLKEYKVVSPRGERNFNLDSEYTLPTIDIEKIEISNKMVKKIVVDQGCSLKYDNDVFESIHKENVTGWQNPYLCV